MGAFYETLHKANIAGRYAFTEFTALDLELLRGEKRIDAVRGEMHCGEPADDPIRGVLYKSVLNTISNDTAAYSLPYTPFLGRGQEGIALLKMVCDLIKKNTIHPLLRAIHLEDVQSMGSATDLARFAFDTCGVEAVVVSPQHGLRNLAPFLNRCNYGIFIETTGESPSVIPEIIQMWNTCANCALVLRNATIEQIRAVRSQTTQIPLLIAPDANTSPRDIMNILQADLRPAPFLITETTAAPSVQEEVTVTP
jgi:hypothetical protein